jgi:hypothetical protein
MTPQERLRQLSAKRLIDHFEGNVKAAFKYQLGTYPDYKTQREFEEAAKQAQDRVDHILDRSLMG